MVVKKYIGVIMLSLLSLLASCSQGFDSVKAKEILLKTELSESEYSELIHLYEIGMDDSLKIAREGDSDISKEEQEEMITMFAIAKRLMVDRDKLTKSQVEEFDRITNKGAETIGQ